MTPEQLWINDFPDLFPEKITEDFIHLLGEVWNKNQNSFHESWKEDEISRTIIAKISLALRARNIRWGISCQSEIIEIDKTGKGTIVGRCDLTLNVLGAEYIYECKRLNTRKTDGRLSTLATEYIKEGLSRFLNPAPNSHNPLKPQYPSWQGYAGMLGYIMDGDTQKAHEKICKRINELTTVDKLQDPYSPSCPALESHRFLSEHYDISGKKVTIHHILLPIKKLKS